MCFKFFFLLLFLFVLTPKINFSQCCSSGSPLGVTSNTGMVDKGIFRVSTAFRYNFSEGYLEGTKPVSNYGLLSSSNYFFQGIVLNYGINYKLSSELEFGYFYAKNQYLRLLPGQYLRCRGLSNATMIVKYGLLNSVSAGIEVSLGTGVKFPFTFKPKFSNNVELPADIQPSTQAFGAVGVMTIKKEFSKIKFTSVFNSRFEYNLTNSSNYHYGSRLSSSLIFIKRINNNWAFSLITRFNFLSHDQNMGKELINTGSKTIVVAPQLRYILNKKWYLIATFENPVYRNMNGKQITYRYSYTFGLLREFKL